MRTSTVVKLKAEIKRASKVGYLKDVQDKIQRLRDIRRLWRKMGEDRIVTQMRDVVEAVVEQYEIDFYFHDLSLMEQSSAKFLWYVYESGTDLVWLEGSEETVIRQQYCFNTIRSQKSDGITVDTRHRMYIVDRRASEIKEVTKFDDVSFHVVEDERQFLIGNAS